MIKALGGKVIWLCVILSILVMSILGTLLFFIVQDGFTRLEDNILNQGTTRIHQGIENQLTYLVSKSADWGRWDTTYEFVTDINQKFIKENIIPQVFKALDINFIIFFDNSGKVVYESSYDFKAEKEIIPSLEILKKLQPLNNKFKIQQDLNTLDGFLLENETSPIIFAAQRILKTDESGPGRGVLLFGKYFNDVDIKNLAKNTLSSLEIKTLDNSPASKQNLIIKDQLLINKNNFYISRKDNNISAYTLIYDFENKPAFIIQTKIPPKISNQGKQTISYLWGAIIIACFTFGITFFIFFKKIVLLRIFKLSNIIHNIGKTNSNKLNISLKGNDEISYLSEEIQNMLNRIIESKQEMIKFKLALDNASDHIVITNIEGEIIYVNDAAEKITGYSKQEIIKKHPEELWAGNMEQIFYEKLWHTIKEEKKIFHGEIKNKNKDGKFYIVDTTIIPILNENNEVIFYVGIERDITSRKEVEKQKYQFISLASHQLRTPLTSIKWMLQILLQEKSDNLTDEQKEFLNIINQSNEKLIKMVNDLLLVTRTEMYNDFYLQIKLINISELLNKIIDEKKSLAEKRGIKLVLESSPENNSTLFADNDELKRALESILDNAINYSYEKKEITIGYFKKNDDCIFFVRNFGIGISKKEEFQIFENFFRGSNIETLNPDGNGLSLFIAKLIAQAHGGKIWFESEENKETTFYISIPSKNNSSKN